MKNAGWLAAALAPLACALLGFTGSVLRAAPPSGYAGRPYRDAVHAGVPQRIPGPVFCAYYDSGGEGIAYHDTEAENQGSGKLNPADGSYLNEFRRHEGFDTSYTKQIPDLESTFDPAETIPWRQWHHWNVAYDAFEVMLPKGMSVLTVRIMTDGNLNLATLDFRLKGSPRTEPGITAFQTPSTTPVHQGVIDQGDRYIVDGRRGNLGRSCHVTDEHTVTCVCPCKRARTKLTARRFGPRR